MVTDYDEHETHVALAREERERWAAHQAVMRAHYEKEHAKFLATVHPKRRWRGSGLLTRIIDP